MSSTDSEDQWSNRRVARYRPLPLLLFSRIDCYNDIDNVTIEQLPVNLLNLFVAGEVELCRRFIPKSPSGLRRCCIVDHPVHIFVSDADKDDLITAIMDVTAHSFLSPGLKRNVFLGLPSPRRVSFVDFRMSLTIAGISDVDVQVYGQKASLDSYAWLSGLPPTATSWIDFGWYV